VRQDAVDGQPGGRSEGAAADSGRGFLFAQEGPSGSTLYFQVAADESFVPVSPSGFGAVRFVRFTVGRMRRPMWIESAVREGAVLLRCARCMRPLGRVSAVSDGIRFRLTEMPMLPAQDRARSLVGYMPADREVPRWVRHAASGPDVQGPMTGAEGWWVTSDRVGTVLRWLCRCGPRRMQAVALIRAMFDPEVQGESGDLWGVVDV
jgi:hypothetical protein